MRNATATMRDQFRSLGMLQRAGVLALLHTEVPDRGLPAIEAEQYRTLLVATPYFARVRRELDALDESAKQLRDARDRDLLRMPVVVISRGIATSNAGPGDAAHARDEQVWRGLQQELAAMAHAGAHVVAESSGHDVHVEQPLVVVTAIRRLVEQVRRERKALTPL